MVKRTKKILALCLALTMLIACMVIDVGATSAQYFTITESASAAKGATVSLTVRVSDVKLLKGVQGTLHYDASALYLDTSAANEDGLVNSITGPGTDSFNNPFEARVDNTAGYVNFIGAREPAYAADETASPVLMVLNFTVKDTAVVGQSYTLTFSDCKSAVTKGVYTDMGTPGTSTVTIIDAVPVVSVEDIHNTIVGLDLGTMEYAISTDGGTTYSALYTSDALTMKYASLGITTLTGNKMVKVRYKAVGQTPASQDAVLTFTPDYGDVNGDGNITISDVMKAMNIAGGGSATDPEKYRANINSKTDATVTISDVMAIMNRAGGTLVQWAVEQ